MFDRRIVPALVVMGVLTSALYVAVFALLWLPSRDAAAGPAPAVADFQPDRVYYRVDTARGTVDLLSLHRSETADAPVLAEQRHGPGCSLRRLEPPEAQAMLADGARRAESGLGERTLLTWAPLLLLLLPASLLLVARGAHRRQQQLDDFWAIVSPTLDVDADTLLDALAIDRPALQQLIVQLNEARGLELRWEPAHGHVRDRRLSHSTIDVTHCPRCNEAVRVRFAADMLQVPECRRCMAPLDGAQAQAQRDAIVARLRQPPPVGSGPRLPPFSLTFFVIWALVLPPVAAAYAQRATEPDAA